MADKITKETTLGEVVNSYPESAKVLMQYGLHCIGCHVSAFETIEQGSKAHGLSDEDIEKMVKEINEIAEQKEE